MRRPGTAEVTYRGRGTFNVENLREADFVAQPGDSGGPVFSGTEALGIIIAGEPATDPDRGFEYSKAPSLYHEIESAQSAVGGYTVLTRIPGGGLIRAGG